MSLAPRGRVVSVGLNPGRDTIKGLTGWRGRALLILEQGARTVLSFRFDRCLPPRAAIVAVDLAVRGVEAQARFDERTVEVDVWGSRAWYGDGYAWDYGFDRADNFELRVALSTGETHIRRCYVRAPSLDRDWRSYQTGPNAKVQDLRRQPITGRDDLVISDLNAASSEQERLYTITDFGTDFSEDFGS